MNGDFSRETFKPRRHYKSVRAQQGRVQLDADLNEQTQIQLHREETTTLDVIGPCGAPEHAAGFRIGVTSHLHAVHFHTDATHGWAVGESGLILATADGGVTWVR